MIALVAIAAALGGAAAGPRPAAAQEAVPAPAPWRPPVVDSVRTWAQEGLALLANSTSDSLGPNEAAAYERFDRIARRHFARLGPRHMAGARGVLAVFDSLGVPAEFAQDADLPQFCALTFFHPKYDGYVAVTYLYWFRGEDLYRQRMLLTGGRGLQMDVWWTGNPLGPYEVAFLDRRRTGETRETFFTMLRMSRQAEFWGVIQYGRKDVDLGGPGTCRFVDLNNDAIPEVVNWSEAAPDARFVVDPHLPPLLSERLWQRTDTGFVLFDRRTVPTPFATWVLFLRSLVPGGEATARALVATPSVLTRARTLGLGAVTARESWQVLEAPDTDRWNQRLSFVYGSPHRNRGLEVLMGFKDGHWVISSIQGRSLNPVAPKAGTPATPGAPGAGAGR